MSAVTAAIFRDGRVIEHVALEGSRPQDGKSEFIWIEVLNPAHSDFAVLQKRFNLHTLAVEASMAPALAPKVDLYDDQVFVVLQIAQLENDSIQYEEIDAFVSGRHIITVRHAGKPGETHAHGRLLGGPTPAQARPDFILHAILDFVVDSYFPIVQMIEDEVLSMEQHLQDALLGRDEITRLFRLRRESIQFQHVLAGMSGVCGKLTNLEVPCIGPDVRPYFRDVHDRLVRLDGMVSRLIDVIRTVFETSNLLEQQRQGTITRQLAAWAAILGVPTVIAAIYGMSFTTMPTMDARYAIVFGGMVAVCAGLYLRFRKLRWL